MNNKMICHSQLALSLQETAAPNEKSFKVKRFVKEASRAEAGPEHLRWKPPFSAAAASTRRVLLLEALDWFHWSGAAGAGLVLVGLELVSMVRRACHGQSGHYTLFSLAEGVSTIPEESK